VDLRAASRIDLLLASCHEELAQRKQGLRILKSNDDCRRLLVEYTTAVALAVDSLDEDADIRGVLQSESNKPASAVTSAYRTAAARLAADLASGRQGLPAWVAEQARAKGDDRDAAWQSFLDAHHLYRALDEFGADVAAESARSGKLFEASQVLKEHFKKTRSVEPVPGRGFWGRLKSAVNAVGRAVVRLGKSFGLSQGAKRIFAKLAGRGVPGVNVVLVIGDALSAVSIEARHEMRQRQVDVDNWRRDAHGIYSDELDDIGRLLQRRLIAGRTSVTRKIRTYYKAADGCLDDLAVLRRGLSAVEASLQRRIQLCDRLLVERLAACQGLTPIEITQVRRTPNHDLHVTCGAGKNARRLRSHLQPLMLTEQVTVVVPRSNGNGGRR